MKNVRLVLLCALMSVLGLQAFAQEQAFMGFDASTQKMYAVVRAAQPFRTVVTYTQSNPGGWIGDVEVFYADPVHPREAWSAGDVSPVDRERFTDIPEGQINVITARFDLYNENDDFIGTFSSTDTLVAHYEGDEGQYIYQNGCNPVLPNFIPNPAEYPEGWSFCAFICHGSYALPVYCDPRYPDFNGSLQFTVSNGCHPDLTHCDDPSCPPIDWDLFAYNLRTFPGNPCHKFLIMTYCDGNPGCVCIWSWDTTLAVQMNEFTAIPGDRQVTLNWSTASESDLLEFRVSRSETRDGLFVEQYAVRAQNASNGASYTWTDRGVENGKTYYYRLYVVDAAGAHAHDVIAAATPGSAPLPAEFELSNFPNPFNSQTTFAFALPTSELVTLKVYDLLGREVATVINETMTAGNHSLNWSADGLTTGVYMYTLTAGSYSETKKLLFLK